MKIHNAIELAHKYGRNTTLGDLVRIIQGNKIYKCPKCNGIGKINRQYIVGQDGITNQNAKKLHAIYVMEKDIQNMNIDLKWFQDGWE